MDSDPLGIINAPSIMELSLGVDLTMTRNALFNVFNVITEAAFDWLD